MKYLKSMIHRAGRWYIRRLCRAEADSQRFFCHNERPIEYRFAFEALAASRPVTVLDVGTGLTAWPAVLSHCGYVVTAIDNMRDYWPADAVNRYWSVRDVDITRLNGFKGSFDAITCISVIEHIENHAQAIRNMSGLLKPGGVLIVTTPYAHNTPHPNVYTHKDALYGKNATYICRSSSQAEIAQWLACGLSLERRELWRLFTGPVWATGQRCDWEKAEDENRPHQLGCFLFRKAVSGAPTGQ